MPVPPEPPLDCPLCPRLVAFREANAAAYPDFFNAPVPSFGDPEAELLIVGLAPGLKGANQTGRPFTGDYAGDLLYATLEKHAFSSGSYAGHSRDGVTLKNAMITNAVRCVPPQNKPETSETNQCRPFLASRFAALPRLKAILALGKIAHDNTLKTLGYKLNAATFAHGAEADLDGPNGPVRLFDSYHCSRYNTNTGRLTEAMFDDVFEAVRAFLGR